MGNQCCAHLPSVRILWNGFMQGRSQSVAADEMHHTSDTDDAFALSASCSKSSDDSL